jgi:DNA invertase Pin-like site-specific DNA recombinase
MKIRTPVSAEESNRAGLLPLRVGATETGVRYAIVYGRYSKDEQGAGDSFRRQTEEARKYAEAHGLVILMVLFDRGFPGYHGDNIKSGKLGKLLKDIRDGKIKPGTVLLVESLDRLSREAPISQFLLLAGILKAGIEVVTIGDGKRYTLEAMNNNPHDLFGAVGIMTRGNDEAKTKDDRHTKNWAEKRKRANEQKLTANGPAWLKLMPCRKRWKQLRKRVTVVRRIFKLTCDGLGRHRITKLLNRLKVPPWGRAKFWTKTYVGRILRNRAVLGEFQPCERQGKRQVPVGERVKGYYTAIISMEQFDKANAIRQSRVGKPFRRNVEAVPNLFRGIAFDGKTGYAMHYKKVVRTPRHSFLFSSAAEAGAATNYWNYASLEQNVLHHLETIDWAQLTANPKDDARVKEERRLEAAIVEIRKQIMKLLSLISSDTKPPKTLVAEMKRLENAQCELEKEKSQLLGDNDGIVAKQREMALAKEEIQNLVRAGDTETRKRLREEIGKLVERFDIWAIPGTCPDLRALKGVIADAVRDAGWSAKANPALWPCYRITFANGAIRWVLCRTRRLPRCDSRRPYNPANDSIILQMWNPRTHGETTSERKQASQ